MISSRWRPPSRSSSWCWARRAWASALARCAPSTASRTPFSRSSIMASSGFQASFAMTMAKMTKRTRVATKRTGSGSMSPPLASRETIDGPGIALLEGEEDGDDQREEGGAFDQAGGHDHGAADVAARVGLARHSLQSGRGQAADAGGSADDGEPGSDAGGEVRHCLGIHFVQLLIVSV